MSVVSAVCVCVATDSSFGYLCEAPGLGEGLAALEDISWKMLFFFHHGFTPDGLTLSAGGLAATSLKADHTVFVCY